MYKQLVSKHEFTSNVLTTISGAFFSQIIPILIMPLLTRLYSPSDFGIFALYISLATICSVIATGRYELAIMLPKISFVAFNLTILSIIISVFVSLFFLLIIYTSHHAISTLIGNPLIEHWLFLIPVSILLTGILQSLIFWNTRKKQYTTIALAKITQGSSTSGIQLVLSTGKSAHLGLIFGYVFSLLFPISSLLRSLWKKDRSLFAHLSIKRMMMSLIKYKKFPLYSTAGAFLDCAAVQMPIFMLSKFYSSEITGLFSLTFRTLNLPMILIASSISQVLFQKISHHNNYEPELLSKLIIKSFFILLSLSLPFLFVLFFWGGDLFSLVFGQEWGIAGQYASIIVFAIVIRFSVSPLSSVMIIERNLKLGVFWQLTYFITISITLYIAAKYTITTFMVAFVIHEIILYLFYLYLILLSTKSYQYH